jgi:hypothetical protein
MKSSLPVLLACVLFSAAANAQPVLTSTNSAPKIGDVQKRQGVYSAGVTLGSGGANVTWDYSSLLDSGSTISFNFVDPATTPFAASFPGTNVAETIAGGNGYSYYKINSSVYQVLGAASDSGATAFYNKPYYIVKFPFTYGSFFTDSINETLKGESTPITGLDSVSGDGYGTLKMPGHTYTGVLRGKSIANRSSTVSSGGFTITSNTRIITIIYILPGNANTLLNISQSTNSTLFNGVPFGSPTVNMHIDRGTTDTVCKPSLGNDTTLKVCPGSSLNITNVYNTAGLTTSWTTPRPDSVVAGKYTLIVTSTLGCKDTAVITVINNPKPNIGNDTTVKICAGSAVNLYTVYNTAGYIPQWNTTRPDSAVAGKYTLIVTSITTGCKDTAIVTVAANPKPNLGRDTTVKICAGSYTNIKNLYNTTGLTAAWSTARPDSVGVGSYTLIVTNTTGCKDTAIITVAANPKPNLGKDTTVKICAGTYANIKNIYNTTGLTVSWSVARPDSVGAGKYTLIVTNATGCKDTAIVTVIATAKPNLGKDTTIFTCKGTKLNLTTVYITTGLTTLWSTARPDSVVAAGKYTLIVTNGTGCADTAVITVSYYPKPNLGKDTTITTCKGTKLNLTAVYNTTGLTTAWSTTHSDSIVIAGKYTLIVTNSNGCKDTAVITVANYPKPNLGKDTAIIVCGKKYNLTAVYNTTGLTTLWNVTRPDSVTKSGSYRLIVTNSNGCKDTAVVTLTFKTVLPVLNPADSAKICSGDTLTVSVLGGPYLQYAWSDSSTAATLKVAKAGTYKVTVKDSSGCTGTSAGLVVKVLSVPAVPVVTSNPTAPTNLCPGTSVTLTSSAATGNLWSTSDTSKSIILKTAGSYTVKVTIADGCSKTSLAKVVTYKACAVPAAPKTSNITATGATISWAKVPCAARYDIQYRVKGTTTFTNANTTDSFYTIAGLTASTAYEWKVRTDCIVSPLTASAYNALTAFTTTSGLLANNTGSAKQLAGQGNNFAAMVAPNPARNSAQLRVTGVVNNYSVCIFDMAGKRLWQTQQIAGNTAIELPVQTLASGLYMVSITSEHEVRTIKWIVSR